MKTTREEGPTLKILGEDQCLAKGPILEEVHSLREGLVLVAGHSLAKGLALQKSLPQYSQVLEGLQRFSNSLEQLSQHGRGRA